MVNQSIFTRIGTEYYSYTASEKKLADYVLSVQAPAARMSISEMAQACGVADATVSRFCRRLGYRDYQEFKLAIAQASAYGPEDNPLSGEVTPEDDLETISRKLLAADTMAMTQTAEVLDPNAISKAAEMFRTAGRILCMGQGGSMLIAQEAAHLFATVSTAFTAVSDSHMQVMAAATMDSSDMILFFSYSGSTLAMMDTLKIARERGARVVLVTRFPNSPGAELADVILQCGANENPLQSGSVAARIAQMYLLDVLFSEYCRKNLGQTRDMRNWIAQALSVKHL